MRSRGAGNLPSEVADLVGRSRELVQVREILSHTRILTLTGVGGVGKTKLAVRVGRRLEGSYPKGVWLVELAAFADPTLLTGVVARALGVAEDPGSDLETSIVARLGGGSALLLLDNCEHLLDASANLVHRLLGRCPELRVLATSRAPLGLEGETTLAVAP